MSSCSSSFCHRFSSSTAFFPFFVARRSLTPKIRRGQRSRAKACGQVKELYFDASDQPVPVRSCLPSNCRGFFPMSCFWWSREFLVSLQTKTSRRPCWIYQKICRQTLDKAGQNKVAWTSLEQASYQKKPSGPSTLKRSPHPALTLAHFVSTSANLVHVAFFLAHQQPNNPQKDQLLFYTSTTTDIKPPKLAPPERAPLAEVDGGLDVAGLGCDCAETSSCELQELLCCFEKVYQKLWFKATTWTCLKVPESFDVGH